MSVQNSIIVINHNSSAALAKMLSSLRIEEAITTEVIVVDSASDDDSAAMVRQHFPRIRLLTMTQNRGWAAAANRGLRDALGEVVVVCHADIVAPIHNLVELADRVREGAGKRIGIMLPRLIDAAGNELPFVGRLPGLASTTIGMFNPPAVRRLYLPTLDHVPDNEWSILPCAALNAEWLEKIGNFDERFFRYYADADICLRFHERNYRIGISRDIRVVHLRIDPTPAPIEHRLMRKDHKRYVEKHRPAWERGVVNLYGMLRKDAG